MNVRPKWPDHFGSRCEGRRPTAELACFAKRSAHEPEEKVDEAVDFGGDEEATGTKISLDNMEAEAHANALLAAEQPTEPT